MLRECLDLAHGKGLNVVPWFEYGFFALKGNTLRRRRPDWFTQKRDGTQVDSHNMEWLNPFTMRVQAFFLELIDELMARYDVDGFKLMTTLACRLTSAMTRTQPGCIARKRADSRPLTLKMIGGCAGGPIKSRNL
jgi:uncharacterized lipoprotein YddW (UPF0748 family)